MWVVEPFHPHNSGSILGTARVALYAVLLYSWNTQYLVTDHYVRVEGSMFRDDCDIKKKILLNFFVG